MKNKKKPEHFSRDKPRLFVQVHCHFKSGFSKECALMLPLSIPNTLAFPQGHPVACLRLLSRLPATYILPSFFFHRVFQKAVPTQHVTNPVSFPSFYCTLDISLPLDSMWYFFISHTIGPTYLRFIHSVFCLTTGPKPPPKRFLHIVRSRASSFKWEYPLLSLRSSSSFPTLLPLLLVTSISPFIFPSITCFRRQFLRIFEVE